MPVFNLEDNNINTDNIIQNENIEKVVPTHKYRTQEELKTSTMFNKEKPLDTLVANVSGMDWEVSYFMQIRGINDAPMMPDVNTSQTILKYNRINKLIIKLQSAIDQTNIEEITGEAIINAGFVPSYGDVFIATLTGGREAVFVITEIRKNNYNLHNVYLVIFKLHAFLDTSSTFYNDLLFKTVSEYVYDKDYLTDFSSPIILKEDYHKKIDLKKQPKEILDYYMRYMVNRENNILAAPTVSSIYIDTLLTDFLGKIINHNEHEDFIKLNKISIELKTKDSIWDVLLKRDISLLKRVNRDIGFKYTPSTISNPSVRHVSYLGISFITDTITQPLEIQFQTNEDFEEHEPPLIFDGKYIFSDNFYNQNIDSCTEFELLVLQYLRGEIVDSIKLEKFLNQYPIWKREHQFYLLPILILLVKNNVANTFSAL